MKIVKTALVAAFLLLGIAVLAPGDMIMAQTPEQVKAGVDSIGGGDSPSMIGTVGIIVNAFLYLIGALAVVMIVYSGFRYVTSSGDSSAVGAAKNTLLYAVVGLVVAVLSYAIVNTVLGIFDEKPLTAEQCQQIPVELRYHEEECS